MQIVTQKKKIKKLSEQNLLRVREPISARDGNVVLIKNKSCINFSGNDYLGLSTSDELKNAFISGVNRYGVGSSASQSVSGYFDIQHDLEVAFCEFLGRERALLFNSGYNANIGALSSILNRQSLVISDKRCHASILDGIQLSRAKHGRYRHNDMSHLEELTKNKKPDLIVTESVFSMSGCVAQLEKIIELKNAVGAGVFVDDAHGVGILNSIPKEVDCLMTPFGKSFGCMGAVISGSHDLIETCLQFARSHRYTTALPPGICVAMLKALEIIQRDTWRIEQLKNRIQFFIRMANDRGIQLSSDEITPIKCVVVGDNANVIMIQKELRNKGFLVAAIRPPAVPKNKALIRMSLNSLHTELEITQLLDCLEKLL